MDLRKKGITLATFTMSEQIDESEIYDLLKQHQAPPVEFARPDQVLGGWSTATDVLDTNFNDASCRLGDYYSFHLLKSERKAPPKLIDAVVAKKIREYQTANGLSYCPAKVRNEIKKEERQKLDLKALPVLQWAQIVIDNYHQMVYVLNGSQTILDEITSLFYKTFGLEIFQVSPLTLAIDAGIENPSYGIGREFLTWCLWKGEVINLSSLIFMVEDPLELYYDDEHQSEGTVSTSIAAKGECSPRCAELQTALVNEKTIRKCGLNVVYTSNEWFKGKLDGERWIWSSLVLPTTEECDPLDDAAARIDLIYELHKLLTNRFKEFLVEYQKKSYQAAKESWINNRV